MDFWKSDLDKNKRKNNYNININDNINDIIMLSDDEEKSDLQEKVTLWNQNLLSEHSYPISW